jgi:hypothetical protein
MVTREYDYLAFALFILRGWIWTFVAAWVLKIFWGAKNQILLTGSVRTISHGLGHRSPLQPNVSGVAC